MLERWRAAKNRLLASEKFQRWAAGFPLTRPVAQRRARALFDLCAGFVFSQVLLACVRLRLCEMLMEGPQDVARLAQRMAVREDSARRLLDAAATLRLAERRRAGVYAVGPLGAALVGNPAVAAMVEHNALLYADLRDPVALLRGALPETALRRHWPYAADETPVALPDDQVAPYSALMAASQPLVAADVLAAFPLRRHRHLMDVGGGDGTFLLAAAAQAPQLALTLFDLPAVAARAEARFAAAGLGDRAKTVGGDFRAGLPGGADVISLVRVLHDHEDDSVRTLLAAARAALAPGGTLLVAEPMAGTRGAESVGAYFDFYLLAMGSGRPRRPAELADMLRAAGFARVRLLRTRRPMLVRVLVGHV